MEVAGWVLPESGHSGELGTPKLDSLKHSLPRLPDPNRFSVANSTVLGSGLGSISAAKLEVGSDEKTKAQRYLPSQIPSLR